MWFSNYIAPFLQTDDVLARMMDDRSSEACRTLLGHSGPVYRVAFSPDRQLLLSCSEDSSSKMDHFIYNGLNCVPMHDLLIFFINLQFAYGHCSHGPVLFAIKAIPIQFGM